MACEFEIIDAPPNTLLSASEESRCFIALRALSIGLALASGLLGCRSAPDGSTLFTLLDEKTTGISFTNTLTSEPEFNILDYLYFYDGAGVALGDIDKDGLDDIFFTSNQGSNRLYLNKGDFRFEDVSETAGITSEASEWSTGVTMADVNGDGWLDIYVCQVNYRNKTGRNQLFINNRDGSFTDEARAYGLDFEGLSTQAAFFDYDRDGDLDVYLLNHSIHTRESFVQSWRRIVDAPLGDRLYRNDGGRFTNVTHDAGIYSSVLGYGLGLAVSDVNLDGWPDIYIGNDFHENDYLYLNDRDGSFTEVLQRVMGHTSQSSMGNDIADINNDGLADIVSLDMMPADRVSYMKSGGPDSDELARIKQNFGYGPQVARNTLQIHRGFDADSLPLFSEIGAYAGVHATDWSWASLFADLDNDGWKDLFITNGIPRRPNDLDYVAHISTPAAQRTLNLGSIEEQLALTERMPAYRLSNFAFQNSKDDSFFDRSEAWGLNTAGYSNGAAYGDLDNDGDLDLAVNNIDAPAFVYRNNIDAQESHFLAIQLAGDGLNTSGIGARVTVYAGELRQYREQMPTRGFQSSVSHTLHFGLGDVGRVDSLEVIWPDGRYQRKYGVAADQRLVFRQNEANERYSKPQPAARRVLFSEWNAEQALNFRHREDAYFDDAAQPLIPHKLSTQGPALAVADVNGDGLDDVYLGGAHEQAGRLFIQLPGSSFVPGAEPFDADRAYEDVDAAFFDAEGDGDLDLYVVSGGGRYAAGDSLLMDRLYINDGRGRFDRSRNRLPPLTADGCCVAPADIDADGDADLFVGSRSVPGAYGVSPASYLLENDGKGVFTDATEEKAAALSNAGMVTSAVWADFLGDDGLDLAFAGEWMPITILENKDGALGVAHRLEGTSGWWQSLLAADFDGDADLDLMAGNLGTNALLEPPLVLYTHDLDNNATIEPILAREIDGRFEPWARRDELLRQAPVLADRIPTYATYAHISLPELLGETVLLQASMKRVETFLSLYFDNAGGGVFRAHELPAQVQWSPLTAMLSTDVNDDGRLDLMAAGNFFGANTMQGRYDASYGLVLVGDGTGFLTPIPTPESGFIVRGEASAMKSLTLEGGRRAVIVARNNDTPQIFLRK